MVRQVESVNIHFNESEMSGYIQRVLLASEMGSRNGYETLNMVQEDVLAECKRKLYREVRDVDRTDIEKVDFASRTAIHVSNDVYDDLLYYIEELMTVDDRSGSVFLKPCAELYNAHYYQMEEHASSLSEITWDLADVFEEYLANEYVADIDKRKYRTLSFYLRFPDTIPSMPAGDRKAIGKFFEMHIGNMPEYSEF